MSTIALLRALVAGLLAFAVLVLVAGLLFAPGDWWRWLIFSGTTVVVAATVSAHADSLRP